MKKGFVGSVIAVLVVISAAWLVVLNRYNIYDWAKLRDYTPAASISALAATSGMNDKGTKLFYVNDPQIADRGDFNKVCRTTEQTIVLGCYTGTNIYVFKVDDAKLEGVEEVTAAHEMLHAAYQRLGSSEKERINLLLQEAYARVKDKQLSDVMASYQKTEPGEQDNELHSILGTEYDNLGPELEAYYSKYFTDRAKVVKLANDYKKVFEDIQSKTNNLSAKMALIKDSYERDKNAIELLNSEIMRQQESMKLLASSNKISEYNAQIYSYNQKVNQYNVLAEKLRSEANEYNGYIEEYNSLAIAQKQLSESLDSRIEIIK